MILHIYADYDKRIGAYKITYILGRDYGIYISVGRVYRLMRSMQLPPMSTIKPKSISCPKESSGCYADYLHQDFHQKAPNLVWTSDFTYLKAGGKWYYLCIIMDLFPEKLSPGIYHPNPMRIWSSRPFRKHIIPEIVQLDWCFTLIEDHSTQPLHFENCLMNWMCSSPSRKGISFW